MAISHRALLGILVALVAFGSSRDARADSLRCGQRIVATGHSIHVVRSLCGEPTAQQQRIETRTERRRVMTDCGTSKTPHRRCERVEKVTRQVQIDVWTYDFGPRRFIQILTFADGVLEKVEADGRGGHSGGAPNSWKRFGVASFSGRS